MSALFIGLLSAILVTNSSETNQVSTPTVGSTEVVNTNDPVEIEYRKLLLDDDDAQQNINKWSENAQAFSQAGGGDPNLTLHMRIRQRLDEIKKEYDDFLERHPNHTKALLAYGSFLNDTHEEEAAAAEWEKARTLEPNNPAAWNNLANYYGHRGPIKKAFEYYEKAIELDGHESVYYQNLALIVYLYRPDAEEYYKMGEQQVFDKALGLYRKAIQLDPNNFNLFSDYAESFYGTNPPRWKDGLAAWTDALKIVHDEEQREGVYIHLARINLKLGNFTEARQSLNEVTNAFYATLKNKIGRNLDEAIAAAAGTKVAPVR